MVRRAADAYTNMTFETLDQLSDFITKQVHPLSPTEAKAICNFDYFNNARHLWAIP